MKTLKAELISKLALLLLLGLGSGAGAKAYARELRGLFRQVKGSVVTVRTVEREITSESKGGLVKTPGIGSGVLISAEGSPAELNGRSSDIPTAPRRRLLKRGLAAAPDRIFSRARLTAPSSTSIFLPADLCAAWIPFIFGMKLADIPLEMVGWLVAMLISVGALNVLRRKSRSCWLKHTLRARLRGRICSNSRVDI